jgi:anthranilate/para-aminobenzoate synthase component II
VHHQLPWGVCLGERALHRFFGGHVGEKLLKRWSMPRIASQGSSKLIRKNFPPRHE